MPSCPSLHGGSPRCLGPSIAPSSSSPHLLTLDRAGQPREPLLCSDSHPPGILPGKCWVAPLKGRAGVLFYPPLAAGDVVFRPSDPPRGAEWDSIRGSRCSGRLRPLPACPPFTRAAPPPFAPLARGPPETPGAALRRPAVKIRPAESRRARASGGRDARGSRAGLSLPRLTRTPVPGCACGAG